MDDRVVVGFVEVVAISLVPVGIVWAGVHAQEIAERAVLLGRRARLLPPAPEPPAGPPLEKLATQLRRLRPEARSPRPGIPMARHRGIIAAYDEVLLATAKALDVPTPLCDLPDGLDRVVERLRLEDALEAQGLSWQLHQS
jgi:hypothetical protein